MTEKWVTLATFTTVAEASVVRKQLKTDGVDAVINEDSAEGFSHHLGLAVSGIKLQVADDDFERAIEILDANDREPFVEDDWRNEVDAADRAAGSAPDPPDEQTVDEPENATDEMVHRAFRAAALGTCFFPLLLYSLWLLIRVAFEPAPMNGKSRRRVLITLLLNIPVYAVVIVLVYAMLSA